MSDVLTQWWFWVFVAPEVVALVFCVLGFIMAGIASGWKFDD